MDRPGRRDFEHDEAPERPLRILFVDDNPEHRRLAQLAIQREIPEIEAVDVTQKMDAIGQLAGGVAHDFNNMLTVIDGFSTLRLDELDTTDARRELVEEIRRATGRAVSLTGQLMAVSRRQALRLQAVDLNNLTAALQPLLGRVVLGDIGVVVRTADEPVVVLSGR